MPNTLTWKEFKKLKEIEASKERKEKVYSALRFAVIIFMWFAVGFFAGRGIEFLIRIKQLGY